ncbi:hypothetical protein EDB92DRAFT_1873325 [Lactarius akahatsu]|uniref:Uncharacterized protein n=1 Tax=Lactarius akahatsu TaxID=416441 RepID=A0AAD4LFU2_9AGAM|nr:hypothetical protein EDB92DRAFT_1873325 [Lactarius akahatsu]
MTASPHLSVHFFLLGLSPDRAGKAFKYDNTVIEFTWLGMRTISPPKGFMQVHGVNHEHTHVTTVFLYLSNV